MSRTFDIIIERDADGLLVASAPALPGCHTQAPEREELMRRRIREAILFGKVPVNLLDKEGNPFGLGIDQVHQALGRFAARQCAQYLGDLAGAQPFQGDARYRR